jgi:hypothetical protein
LNSLSLNLLSKEPQTDFGVNTINIKLLIALVAIGAAVLLILAGFVGLLIYNELATYEKNNLHYTIPFPAATPPRLILLPVPVIIQQTNSNNQDSSKPNIVVVHVNVLDDRTQPPYSLSVTALLNNTGGGTAYNAYLHVIAYNKEGVGYGQVLLFRRNDRTRNAWRRF